MKKKYNFDHTTADGQKRLMAVSMGLDSEVYVKEPINIVPGKDYGCDPVGDGMFKMIPSGDIVNSKEKKERLG